MLSVIFWYWIWKIDIETSYNNSVIYWRWICTINASSSHVIFIMNIETLLNNHLIYGCWICAMILILSYLRQNTIQQPHYLLTLNLESDRRDTIQNPPQSSDIEYELSMSKHYPTIPLVSGDFLPYPSICFRMYSFNIIFSWTYHNNASIISVTSDSIDFPFATLNFPLLCLLPFSTPHWHNSST